jgi:aminoglycoside 6'-N-acetyltransferase I
MDIIEVTQEDFDEWLELTLKLWSEPSVEEMQIVWADVLHSPGKTAYLVRADNGRAIAFMNLSLRHDYVAGANQSPVAYVEGIYVEKEYQKQGIGKALIQHAEQWAQQQGCVELASDALINNIASYEFHTKVGFREVERVVTFIKPIKQSKAADG